MLMEERRRPGDADGRAPGTAGAAGAAGRAAAQPADGARPTADAATIARAELAAITASLRRLRELSWALVPEAELLGLAVDVETTLRSGYGVQVRLAGECADRGINGTLHRATRSPAHLLAQALRIPVGEAKARVDAAHAGLPHRTPTGSLIDPEFPELAATIDSGGIGGGHARVVTDCMTKLPDAVDPETRALCGRVLLDEAQMRDANSLRKVAEQIRLLCDPDGKLSGKDPVDRAELWFGRLRSDGLTPIRGLLDPLSMEQLRVAVESLAAPQPIDENTPDPRPAEVRRAQALGEILRRYLHVPPNGPGDGGRRPQVGITVDARDLTREVDAASGAAGAGAAGTDGAGPAEAAGTDGAGPAEQRDNRGTAVFDYGTPASLATARLLACDGDLVPLLLDAQGAILDQGRAQRLFTREQRRALITRDRGCAFPGCDIPAGWCEAHHISFWRNGGKTDLANGVLLCRRHHGVIHRGEWRIQPDINPRGRPWFVPPAHIDRTRAARRNGQFFLPKINTAVRRQ